MREPTRAGTESSFSHVVTTIVCSSSPTRASGAATYALAALATRVSADHEERAGPTMVSANEGESGATRSLTPGTAHATDGCALECSARLKK